MDHDSTPVDYETTILPTYTISPSNTQRPTFALCTGAFNFYSSNHIAFRYRDATLPVCNCKWRGRQDSNLHTPKRSERISNPRQYHYAYIRIWRRRQDLNPHRPLDLLMVFRTRLFPLQYAGIFKSESAMVFRANRLLSFQSLCFKVFSHFLYIL